MTRAPRDSSPTGNLWRRSEDGRFALFSRALGSEPAVHRERLIVREGATWRLWEPTRSKLGAAILRGYAGPLPKPGQRWLYLGASTGTTASHVADLVGPSGGVYAVEKSPRPFAGLVRLARSYPNLFPVLGDALGPDLYSGWVPPVDGMYTDVAHPEQVRIVKENARLFLRGGGALILALKVASLHRGPLEPDLLDSALRSLAEVFVVASPMALEPFHKKHYLLAARPRPVLFRETGTLSGPAPQSNLPSAS